jgi:hypothetical protein
MAAGHGTENKRKIPSACKRFIIKPKAQPVVNNVVAFDVSGVSRR